jgi:hypothetical protein
MFSAVISFSFFITAYRFYNCLFSSLNILRHDRGGPALTMWLDLFVQKDAQLI